MRWLLQRALLYGFHVFVVRPVLYGIVGVRFRRRHLLPEGPCLVVSNHNSHLDAAVLMTMFPLRRLARVHPVAAADYFGDNAFRHVVAVMCMNGVTIERRPPPGRDPLAPAIEALEKGDSLIFFPEGSRGEAGVVAPFRRGVGLLVHEKPGLPVVPVFLSGPERIWPRGNVVPLPLAIDAHIGRPRTYDASEDPRLIAAKVRQDVLALAPPRPPVPGKRASPPLRVVLLGAAGESGQALYRATVERLGMEGRTFGIAEPVLEADREGVRHVSEPIAAGRSGLWLRLLARLFRARPGFVELVEQTQLDEALEHARDVRFAVADRSAAIELLAQQAAAVPPGERASAIRRSLRHLTRQERIPLGRTFWFLRRAPEIWLMTTFDLARPPVPDVLVSMRGDVEDRLADARADVAALLRRQRGVEVVELEGGDGDARAQAERIARACQRLTESAPASA